MIGLILAGIIAAIGFPIEGAIALLVVSILGSWWSWCSAPHLIVRSLGARDIGHDDHHRLHNLVEGLCATMGLPTPEILIIDSPHPNALSVGRDPGRSSLVVTSSLEGALTLVELEGVLAHELVHIKRHDMVVSGVAVSAVMLMTRLVGATTGARLVHRFVGEGREFSADQRAAGLVRYPGGLGSALRGMANAPSYTASNPERWRLGFGRRAGLTRWLWVDPMMGSGPALPGELDATGVRADALMLL